MIGWQCIGCKHYKGVGVCEAFPERIPDDIASGETSHTEPYEGDNGIQFEPIEDANA